MKLANLSLRTNDSFQIVLLTYLLIFCVIVCILSAQVGEKCEGSVGRFRGRHGEENPAHHWPQGPAS